MNKTLIIDRTKWLRGEGPRSSALLRPLDRKMCCLGFRCIKAGVSEQEILDKVTPRNCLEENEDILSKLPSWMFFESEPLNGIPKIVCEMMRTNDDVNSPDRYKEEQLTELFAEVGEKIEFIN